MFEVVRSWFLIGAAIFLGRIRCCGWIVSCDGGWAVFEVGCRRDSAFSLGCAESGWGCCPLLRSVGWCWLVVSPCALVVLRVDWCCIRQGRENVSLVEGSIIWFALCGGDSEQRYCYPQYRDCQSGSRSGEPERDLVPIPGPAGDRQLFTAGGPGVWLI